MSLTPNASDAVAIAADSGAKQKPTQHYDAIADVPDKPAVYALCSGRGEHLSVAYVGETAELKTRLRQHLVTRNSSITSSERAVSVNPDAITFVYWWEDKAFKKDTAREAAELIATEQLHPIMRSNNRVSTAAKDKAELDVAFRQSIEGKFCINAPTGILTLRTLDDISAQADEIMARVAKLEQHIAKLEQHIAKLEQALAQQS